MALHSETPQDDTPDHGVLEIPWNRLSTDALDAVLAEFVLREGTDYGEQEFSLTDKKQHVKQQLESGKARLLFDPIENSCHIDLVRN
ncbi:MULTISPECIES: YheU family protein [unclassified Oceanobacter]|uniref:YheU family protein n=1 Tax=unclassified Oceanobacter TaxID=2620260 RepID=UPI0026E20319|nr:MULTISPECIES: YheU family protein [unclassified Oceanobacter]MDO6683011.1 YheU family protein [Oceanobacter sp. 5_MG-2023]MDP2548135.1 YheU family protein [Oceanobacter sp. 4_MG-2023]MDP2609544.1 YheU family protein [Oceanobacter sp. 1_MG-2023]MDP2612995.1 YheU family protein [Oceanobacter sp. 2_MG-2023]